MCHYANCHYAQHCGTTVFTHNTQTRLLERKITIQISKNYCDAECCYADIFTCNLQNMFKKAPAALLWCTPTAKWLQTATCTTAKTNKKWPSLLRSIKTFLIMNIFFA
jgi:hypothetical protein